MHSKILNLIFLLACCNVFDIAAQNQFTQAASVITNDYEGLKATYSVVLSQTSSVYVKMKNTSQNIIIVELMVTPPNGSARLLPVMKISPGRTEVRNIGDLHSMTVSIGVVNQGGQAGNKIPTKVVDQLTKIHDKLTSLKFGSSPVEQPSSAGPIGEARELSEEQARAVLELIFNKEEWAKTGAEITEEDKKMALLFLKELVEKSCPMAVIEGIFNAQFSFDYTIVGLARYIANSVEENCMTKNYESLRRTIALKNKGVFENRKQNGEW